MATTAMNHNHLDDMHDALRQKLTSYGEFLSATLLLKRALDDGELTEVNHLIRRREELIGIIDGLDRRFRRDLQKVSSAERPLFRQRASGTTEDLGRTLGLIVSANQDCGILAAAKCDALKKDLGEVRHKKDGLRGYAPKGGRVIQFLDTRT